MQQREHLQELISERTRELELAKQKNLAEGTGLGLAIAREYIRLLGGDITATFELGRGSAFHFNIIGEAIKADHIPEIHQCPSAT